jgi:NAD(P)-dependent dehydrogenase (short-subunit alcohol dehydrogenase family)
MSRTALVTGAASGIGKTTAELLTERGYRVIGADLHDADITADLTTDEGRQRLVDEATRLSDGSLDAVLAIAGLAQMIPATVAVNYFGMVGTLTGLRPLLVGSSAPRAAGVASMASIHPVDDELVSLLTAGDEPAAMARAASLAGTDAENQIYASSKKAFAQWVRRSAPSPDWAGAGIPLNAVAPGVIATPMTQDLLATEEGRQQVMEMVPMPLNGIAEPIVVARLLAWLVSEENTHLCGQVVFVDGGSDAVIRGDAVW